LNLALGISFAAEEQSTALAVMLLGSILQLAVMLLGSILQLAVMLPLGPILYLAVFYLAFFEQAVQFHDLLRFFL